LRGVGANVGAGIVASAIALDARFSRGERTRGGGRLPIPRLIDAVGQGNVVHLKAVPGLHEFYKGRSAQTFGYSAPILEPVLRFRRGEHIEMLVENALDTPTTIHWHGLLGPATWTADLRERSNRAPPGAERSRSISPPRRSGTIHIPTTTRRGRGGYNRWTINGKSRPDTNPLFTVVQGKRYRLLLNNSSGDEHPVHLHRHSFEITKVGHKPTSGVIKDTISTPRYSTAEVDFVADDPGPTFFHCHHQDHMDEGFAGLITDR
jgi:FtsP/CotA-like multicopper oxidase with cupredoxin domain